MSRSRRRPLPIPLRPTGTPWPSPDGAISEWAVPIKEAAELAEVKPSAIYSRIAHGTLRAYRLGRRLVVRVEDLASHPTARPCWLQPTAEDLRALGLVEETEELERQEAAEIAQQVVQPNHPRMENNDGNRRATNK